MFLALARSREAHVSAGGAPGPPTFPDLSAVVHRGGDLSRQGLITMFPRGGRLQHRLTPVTTNFALIPCLAQLVRALAALLIIAAATATSAQEHPRRPPQQAGEQHASEPRQGEQARESVLRLLPGDSVTEHSVAIPGGDLPYTATAGTFSMFD